MAEKITFTKPKNWKLINKEYYKDFSILDTPATPCDYGFAVEGADGNFDVVSIVNYGNVGDEFFVELKSQLDSLAHDNSKVSEINDFLKDNADGYKLNHTDYVRPIFYKKGTLVGKKVFINIMEIRSNVVTSYSLQIFLKVEDTLYCVSTGALTLEEDKPIEYLIKAFPHINDMINVVIKTMVKKV